MKTSLSHKLGANRKETAQKNRKRDANFSQSKDIREDRGSRQQKFVRPPQSALTHLTQFNRAGEIRMPLRLPTAVASSKRPVLVKLKHKNAKKVTIAGTFNGWHPESTPLRRDQDGVWQTELSLEAGVFEYRFIVDGEWTDDPNAQQVVFNAFGGMNAVLAVPQK